MGLDGVELVMGIEERFGISINDAEAEACQTPADLIEVVIGKLQISDEPTCVSQRAFYRLRSGLIQTLGVSRRTVDLSTDLRLLAVEKSQREIWEDLKTVVHARSWPPLVRPIWIATWLWILSLGLFCVLLFPLHWALAAIGAALAAAIATRLTRPLCTEIPPRYSKLRALVPFAATSDSIRWTRDQVASVVKEVVIEQLGLWEGQYREDADFVKDLRVG
jgi:acyl carrier protein